MDSHPLTHEALPQASLRDYFDLLLRRWWLVAAAAAAGLLVAGLISVTSAPVYQASSRLVVDRSSQTLLVEDFTGLTQQTVVDTLAEIVKSRAVADLALRYLPANEHPNRTRTELRNGLEVQRIRGTDVIIITAEGGTPEQAAANTNAIARGFVDWDLQARRSQASAGAQFIEAQQAKIGQQLREAENALAAYKVAGGQISLSEQTTLAVEKVADFEAQRRVAAAERLAVDASLRRARVVLAAQSPQVLGATVLSEDPVVSQLRAQLAQLEIQLAGLLEQFTDRHPQVIAVKAQIEQVKARLRNRTAQRISTQTLAANPVRESLANQMVTLLVQREALAARESAYASIVDRYLRDARSLPPKEIQLARLTRDVSVAEQTFLLLAQKLQEAKIAEASIVGDIRIVDAATPPNRPISPRPMVDVLLGLALGLLLGVGASYGLEVLDTSFKSPEDVERQLGLPVLAVIPQWRKTNRADVLPLIMEEQRRSPFAESFRHLRTSLLYMSPDRPLRTIEVTSPGPGEGKSTTSANIAAAFAQLGKRVWLVECDLRKPSLAWTFQPKSAFGLTELLVDGLPAGGAAQETSVKNLWIIPSGTKPPNPAELLGSQKMRALLEHGTDGAEMIVLDAPPVLPVTDATVLAPSVDGVVLVVHISKTPREAARRARQQLESVGARLLGVVVNAMPPRSRGHSYYYSYSEYYDTDAGGTEAKAKEPAAPARGPAAPKT
ncbi:MAG TPA: polysaccharide biosynthesis tyrosine autokinase [bacterium]|jgi:tyrosine-protein kinase Etk/Wzc